MKLTLSWLRDHLDTTASTAEIAEALTDLGLKRPQNQDRMGLGHSDPVSLENLNQIDADYMFFGTLGGSSQDNPNAGGTADLSGAQTALKEAEKEIGAPAKITGFVRFALGEGIEREESDFAAEVAAAVKH